MRSSPGLRAAAVAVLLAVAALGLEAQRSLHWSALVDRDTTGWLRVVGLLVLLGLVVALLRRVVAAMRRRGRRGRDVAHGPVLPSERVPLWLRLAALVLAALLLAGTWAVLSQVIQTSPVTDVGRGSPPADPPDGGRPNQSLTQLLLVGLALAAAALAATALSHRRSAQPEVDDEPTDELPVLASALRAAQDELAAPRADPRSSIIAAYRAMASRLGQGLPEGRRSDTSTELLGRAVAAGLVRPGPAAELTELFREARFSRHRMTEQHRQAADSALRKVLDELRVLRD